MRPLRGRPAAIPASPSHSTCSRWLTLSKGFDRGKAVTALEDTDRQIVRCQTSRNVLPSHRNHALKRHYGVFNFAELPSCSSVISILPTDERILLVLDSLRLVQCAWLSLPMPKAADNPVSFSDSH